MGEFFEMVKFGWIYLFGDGIMVLNFIDGSDLVKVCVDVMQCIIMMVEVGGLELLM